MVATMRVKRKKHKKLKAPNLTGPTKVKVGFPSSKSSKSNIEKAVWNEFGTRGSGKRFGTPRGGGFGGPIPERPFMRNAMRDNARKYRNMLKSYAKRILLGETSLRSSLMTLGIQAQGDIQREIGALRNPANSETTIRLKGSSNPLIDSGAMRQAVTWAIED